MTWQSLDSSVEQNTDVTAVDLLDMTTDHVRHLKVTSSEDDVMTCGRCNEAGHGIISEFNFFTSLLIQPCSSKPCCTGRAAAGPTP
jgi:hypothetical protein